MTDPKPPSTATLASHGIQVLAPVRDDQKAMLGHDALAFVAELQRRFGARRRELLQRRTEVQADLDAGWRPQFLEATADVRAGDWRVDPVSKELQDRRVEITGPVDRKMIINALNSGACVFMADFEDSLAPSWDNVVDGQRHLFDAVRKRIDYVDPQRGKRYALQDRTAVLFVRPRGWHLDERHVLVDGQPVAGSLFDFGLYCWHNARELLARGTGPYFYLPKLESHLEARLWNDVFCCAQQRLGIPEGTFKATVLIETILAAFEMDEILYELRRHSAGLNCGRWDYIFSFIKKFRAHPEFVLPDRGSVTMTQHFLRSYSRLLVQTCHRRAAHAMGGMAAQIPIKDDADANAAALAKVRADKQREAGDGHDGTWVAHPGLIALARAEFDAVLPPPKPNQLDVLLPDLRVGADDLLRVPAGAITRAGLRQNLDVALQYLEAWLGGNGCVPIYNLMEDAATAEISRVQVWQWLHHRARLDDGAVVDAQLVRGTLEHELEALRTRLGADEFDRRPFARAAELLLAMLLAAELPDFLTSIAYRDL